MSRNRWKSRDGFDLFGGIASMHWKSRPFIGIGSCAEAAQSGAGWARTTSNCNTRNWFRIPGETWPFLATLSKKLDYDQIQKTGIGKVQRPNTSFSLDLQSGEFQPVARWKHRLSEDQQATLNALVGDTLEELGYAKREMPSTSRHRASLQRMRSL
jgi:hypothetical protein